MENRERGIMGWPLGLGSMYMRLRMVEPRSSSILSSHYAPSTSFSSFSSSSNLDTESTVSFFQDKSKTLGRLIGIRPPDRGAESMYFQILDDEHPEAHIHQHHRHGHRQRRDEKMCDGICIPLLLCSSNTRKKCIEERRRSSST